MTTTRRETRLYGPTVLEQVLGPPATGPSLGVEDGEWVLYTSTLAVDDDATWMEREVMCRHSDWGQFLRLAEQFAPRRERGE